MTDTLKALDERAEKRRGPLPPMTRASVVASRTSLWLAEAESDLDTLREIVNKLMEAGEAMVDGIAGLGCPLSPPFSNDEMGEAGKATSDWRTLIDSLRGSE